MSQNDPNRAYPAGSGYTPIGNEAVVAPMVPPQDPAAGPPMQPVVAVPTPVAAPVAAPTPEQQHPMPADQQETTRAPENVPQLHIYSHSRLFYWWPVWVVGYAMALVTYLHAEEHAIGATEEWFHPSNNLGVLFFMTLFLVILITNVTVRGLASAIVVMGLVTATVIMAYFNVWDPILGWVAALQVRLNFGAYVWFSTLMLITWLLSVFVFDRMSYWRIKPGQITHEFVLGASSKSYDTQNVMLEKFRDDLFRHWILGFGSGDLRIVTSGASNEEILVPNVLFIGSKIYAVQRLIAMRDTDQ